jgi:VCBS repeat-containing protein
MLALLVNGNYTYTLDNTSKVQALAQGQTVNDSFAYTATDGIATSTAQLNIKISGTNDGPKAAADIASVSEDGATVATGNVLTNDSDIDAGDVLKVANAATFQSQYGSLVLASNGGYTYTLNNSAANVQSLAQGQSVVDQFSYTATDGVATASQTLAVTVLGKNDAPILVTALVDRSATANQAISFALPAGSFTDIDQGDVLGYGAQVIDAQGVAQALPTWLTFNAATQTFSGTPTAATALNIRVTAIDRVGALASDVFALTVQAQTPTPTGCGDGKEDDAHSVDDGRGHARTHVVDGGNGADTLDAHKACSDDNAVLMRGGEGNDNLSGGAGDDILQGGAGNDVINGREGRAVLDGGAGNDSLTNGEGSGFFFGGTGNDTLTSGKGADLFAFNRGDGADTVNLTAQSSATDVLSLGKGIRYADLKLRKTSADLVVDMGLSDSMTLKNWYTSSPSQTVGKLQVITVGGDYNASSSNKILNKQVEAFDFTKLVQKFDEARVVNASAASGWAVMNSLLDVHLQGSSTQALGGDLAFQFGAAGSLAGMSLDASQTSLSGGTDWQNLKTRSQLELGTVRLVS